MTSNGNDVPPDGGYGWVVVAACIVISSTTMPLVQCFGIIYEKKFTEMNITVAEITFLLHLYSSIMCSLGILCGPLLKKYNYRQICGLGCFITSTGILLTSLVESYGALIFTLCFLVGTGHGLIMPSSALAMNTYFKKRLTLAMSFCVTAVGLLPIVFPQICNFLLNVYGLRGTVLILCGISLHAIVAALLLRPLGKHKNRKPSSLLENVVKEVYNETTSPIFEQDNRDIFTRMCEILNLELLRERVYVIIVIGMATSYVAELNFVLITPFVLSELAGFPLVDVALAMSIQATADIAGRLVIPIWAHRSGWSPKLMYGVALFGSSLGRAVMVLFCDTRNVVLACTVLLGLAKGAKAVFQALILPKYVTLEQLPSAMGFLMATNGILSLIIGPVIGIIHDLGGSYAYSLYAATILSLFCVVLWWCENINQKVKRTVATIASKHSSEGCDFEACNKNLEDG